MRNVIILLPLLVCASAYCQIRPFDNSKAILPWVYNPSANFIKDFQVYLGYDGRGSNSGLPQSYVAGFRMPLLMESGNKSSASMVGVQMVNTSQAGLKNSTINVNFAHQIAISERLKFAFGLGAGIANMKYSDDDLVYLDQQDPLLNGGENFFNAHLNAGFSLVMNDRMFINIAAPYLVKDHRANVGEIIVRAGYIFHVNSDIDLITAANADTYNDNLIFGGDVRAEWKKTVSLLAGAGRYKYHGGVLLNARTFCLGYTYGRNFGAELNYVPAHQVSVFSNISFFPPE